MCIPTKSQAVGLSLKYLTSLKPIDLYLKHSPSCPELNTCHWAKAMCTCVSLCILRISHLSVSISCSRIVGKVRKHDK